MSATDSAIIESVGSLTPALARSPSAPAKAGKATCQGRSRVRSECRVQATIAMADNSVGSAAMKPTSRLLRPPNPLTICGSQNVTTLCSMC